MGRISIWVMLRTFVAICALFQLCTAALANDHFDNFPVVIGCEYRGMFHAFYLARITPEGLATYVASGRIAGTISLDGQAKAIGESIGGDCLGKTLEQLRASGQAHFIKP